MTLQPGDIAPLFTLLNQNGEPVSLEQYRGSRVLLYFYPKDDTVTCTSQACNLRDNHELLHLKGLTVLGP
ncbi:MAG: hypothetical protein EBX41_08980 [Chitinophagia bacterium]|nr:hypothetical protein [Chitinophagia bacterium]